MKMIVGHRRCFVSSCQVLELLRRRDRRSEEDFDAMGLLQTLCLVKMDTMDGKAAAGKQAAAKPRAAEHAGSSSAQNAGGAENGADRPNSDKRDKVETEMKGKHEHRRRRHHRTVSFSLVAFRDVQMLS